MLEWLANWWDGVELWIVGLWFPFQFALVMVVLLPLFHFVALLIDRVVDRVSAALASGKDSEPALDGAADSAPRQCGQADASTGGGAS